MKFGSEDTGKLVIRIVLGVLVAANGVMFFVNNAGALKAVSALLSSLGIKIWPLLVGDLVAIVKLLFGITFLLGAFFKTSSFLLGTMLLFDAACKYCLKQGFSEIVSLYIMLASVAYGFIFIGAGQYSVQK